MVSVILLNWNGKQFLHECIRSIEAQTSQAHEVIIIDDCSTDGSGQFLQQHYSRYRLFLNEENRGYCGSANLGIRESQGDFVLLMNPDIVLHHEFLNTLRASIAHDATIGTAMGKLLRFDRQTLDSTGQFLRKNLTPLERGYGEPDTGQYEQPEYVFSSCGALAFYRRAMLEDVQLDGMFFDETYLAYYEDLDIGWRAQLRGWKAFYVPTALAYHYRGGGLATFTRKASWIEGLPFVPNVSLTKKPVAIQRHIIKNRYLTLIKNASFREVFKGLPAIMKFEILLWGYVLCARPSLFMTVFEVIRMLPATLRKRQSIQSRRKVFECLSV